MSDQEEHKALTVLDYLIDFADTQEPWLADGLRRIVEKGGWSQTDIDELCQLRKSEALDPSFSDNVYVPLSKTANFASANGDNTASLISVCHVTGVNRLPENQTVPFSPSGITVIYGNNGSGKSGYVRILKSVCKFRGMAPRIEGDIALLDPPKAQAEITVNMGGHEETLAWNGDASLDDPRLRSMFVFDSDVADSYVSAEEAAHFIPFGLQIPRQLTQLMDEVKRALAEDISEAEQQNNDRFGKLRIDEKTDAGKLIKSEDLNARKLDQLSTVSEEEENQLKDLRALLDSRDTKTLIATWQGYDQRLREFRRYIGEGSQLAGAEVQKMIFDTISLYHGAKAAAEEARKALTESSFLSGTAKETWQALWRAAERFSLSEAYPGKKYPNLEDDARCVLCQQPITGEAAARMRIFAQSVAGKHEAALRTAEEKITTLVTNYQAATSLSNEFKKVDTILAELLPLEQKEAIGRNCEAFDALITTLKDALLRREPAHVVALSLEDVTTSIDTAIVKNETRLKQATDVIDPLKAEEFKKKTNELEARFRLGEVKALVLEYFEHTKKIKQLRNIKDRINTTRSH